MSEISTSWNRITNWLSENAPQALHAHQQGTSDDEILQFESALNVKIPDDVRQFYKLVNGDDPNKASTGIFPSHDDFDDMAYGPLAIDQIQREWKIQKELLEGGDFEDCEPEEVDEGIRNESWNPGWIPFAGNGGGDLYCIDMAPDKNGTLGQIISHNHESFDHKLLADSFSEFLADLANRLEANEYSYSEEWGICVSG